MTLDSQDFQIHDVAAFPFVVFRQEAAHAGYAHQWEREMLRLIELGRPFVVVYDQLRPEESHEDRRHRGIWLKHNKEALGRCCKGLISIEPDAERRAAVEAMSEIAVKAFGIPHHTAATRDEALRLARQLTGGG